MAIDSRAQQVTAVAWTFLVVSSIATLLRIYCRGWVIKAFSLDDWLAVGAQVNFIDSPRMHPILTDSRYSILCFQLTKSRVSSMEQDAMCQTYLLQTFPRQWRYVMRSTANRVRVANLMPV